MVLKRLLVLGTGALSNKIPAWRSSVALPARDPDSFSTAAQHTLSGTGSHNEL